jgi:predicted phosphodiesterase
VASPSIPQDVGYATIAVSPSAPVRLGLIADTHIPEARAALWPQVFGAFAGCEAILHAGDIHELWLLDQLEQVAPVFAARGNGDEGFGGRPRAGADARLHDTWIVQLSGAGSLAAALRIGIIHDLTIPEVPPYLTVDNVSRRRFGAEPGTPEALDVVLYGDTHVQRIDVIGPTLCVNPGSPTYPHNLETQLGTIGFLDLDGPAARVSICQLTESGYEMVETTALPAVPLAAGDSHRVPSNTHSEQRSEPWNSRTSS